MCGISGALSLTTDLSSFELEAFTSQAVLKMKHRGPDDQKIITSSSDGFSFGHNRLSIVDLSSGATQPMENENSIIVFNGEIYNYLALKEELFKQGIEFVSNSDTEVLQRYLDAKGTSGLNQLNGMFSFAYFNKKDQSTILVRDRFGVKPLYYLRNSHSLLFGSEIRIFEDYHQKILNLERVRSYITDTAADFGSETIFEDLSQVKPGHFVLVQDKLVSEHEWYTMTNSTFAGSYNQFVNTFEEILWDAIKLRLACDVPLCITLSGGLDSSVIYTLIKERSDRQISVFTFDHPGKSSSELERVKSLTDKYGDELIVVSDPNTTGTSIEEIKEDLDILEFPTWSFSARAYRQMYQEISDRGFKVVIEGHGGDEILGGYQYMIESLLVESLKNFDLAGAIRTLKVISRLQGMDSFFNRKSILLAYQLFRLSVSKSSRGLKGFDAVRAEAIHYRILPIILRTFDRLSMHYSLESRFPLMDFRVVELAKSCNNQYLINSGATKSPLRAILRKYGNLKVADHSGKLGFASDLESMLESTLLRSSLVEILNSGSKGFPDFKAEFDEARLFFEGANCDESQSFVPIKISLLATFLSKITSN